MIWSRGDAESQGKQEPLWLSHFSRYFFILV